MEDIVYTINQFKGTIILNAAVAIFFIVIFIVLLCILKKKNRPKGKAYWIVVLLLIYSCTEFGELIPAFVDIYTNAIEVVEISNCSRQYNAVKKHRDLAHTYINFTTVDGKRLRGYFMENVKTSDKTHGYILYAKHSQYILDFDLYE